MIVLALDTALEACSVAVVGDGWALAVRSEPMARGHQERLAPMVAEAMAEAGLAFEALDRIAVTVGPGSFTGLRVGLAFAKAMSLALDIACVGVGTLEALAASAPGAEAALRLLAAIDAHREQLYIQVFAKGAPTGEPCNLPLQAARAAAASHETVVIGSGAALLGLGAGGAALDRIDPLAVARLAAQRPEPEHRPAPLYLRAPDAKTIAQRAGLQAS